MRDTKCTFAVNCERPLQVSPMAYRCTWKDRILKTVVRDRISGAGTETAELSARTGRKAMGIIDFPPAKLGDSPAFLEDKLRRTQGVTMVEINAFSKKITVEFDPSVTSLDKIRKILATKNS